MSVICSKKTWRLVWEAADLTLSSENTIGLLSKKELFVLHLLSVFKGFQKSSGPSEVWFSAFFFLAIDKTCLIYVIYVFICIETSNPKNKDLMKHTLL